MKEILKHLKLNFRLLKTAWKEEKFLLLFYYFTSFLGVILLFLIYYLYQLVIDQVFYGLTIGLKQTIFVFLLTYLFSEYIFRFVYYVVNSYLLEYILRSKFQKYFNQKIFRKASRLRFCKS